MSELLDGFESFIKPLAVAVFCNTVQEVTLLLITHVKVIVADANAHNVQGIFQVIIFQTIDVGDGEEERYVNPVGSTSVIFIPVTPNVQLFV